jgi:SAM-dependent methyltransferase
MNPTTALKECTDKKLYDTTFYKENRNDKKLKSVSIVLAEVIKVMPKINSAVDFGCGVGTWLAGLQRYGVLDICGFDGKWVNKDLLVIPKECFFEVDLDKPFEIKRKFDLAISIEVAEHLSENIAVEFIKTLTMASDIVLFSAAIPFQGGTNHINEQWPEYWNNIFQTFDYVAVDCLRKMFWTDNNIQDFYKQNILIYIKKERVQELNILEGDICINYPPMALISPERYLRLISQSVEHAKITCLLKKIIARIIKKIIGKRFYARLRENM